MKFYWSKIELGIQKLYDTDLHLYFYKMNQELEGTAKNSMLQHYRCLHAVHLKNKLGRWSYDAESDQETAGGTGQRWNGRKRRYQQVFSSKLEGCGAKNKCFGAIFISQLSTETEIGFIFSGCVNISFFGILYVF